jgi:hypothetical protein
LVARATIIRPVFTDRVPSMRVHYGIPYFVQIFLYRLKSLLKLFTVDKNSCFIIYVSYCVLKSTTLHIDHYTVHIPRGGEFTIGGVTTNRHKLISLESKQSIICHCGVCITICPSSLIIGFRHVVSHTSYLTYLCVICLIRSSGLCDPLCVLSCFYWTVPQCRESENLDLCILYVLKCNISFFMLYQPFVQSITYAFFGCISPLYKV